MTKSYKTKGQRLAEVIKVLKKIQTLGLPRNNNGLSELEKILKIWVNDGKYNAGKIKLECYNRMIYYELYTRSNVEIAINLKCL